MPFNDDGTYTGTWQEVTDHVMFDKIGSIEAALDNTQYNIGVFRNNSFTLSLSNSDGYYSDVGGATSIFRYKRGDSKVKIEWQQEESGANTCGTGTCGEFYLSDSPTVVFQGLLTDDNFQQEIIQDEVSFTVLGRESLFKRLSIPTASIDPGTPFDDCIFNLLNQDLITNLLTVDASYINPTFVSTGFDDISSFSGKTAQDVLDIILQVTNSVLYIDHSDRIVVQSRSNLSGQTVSLYGQGSSLAPETAQNISGIMSGRAKIYNYIVWQSTASIVSNAGSVQKYGVRQLSIGDDSVTSSPTITSSLDSTLTEFEFPKREMKVTVPIEENPVITLLDLVSIDYPAVYVSTTDDLPICGAAVCGAGVLPQGLWSFTLTPDQLFKILGYSLDLQTGLVVYYVRET